MQRLIERKRYMQRLPFSYAEYEEFQWLYLPDSPAQTEGDEKAKLPKLLKSESFRNLAKGGTLSHSMVVNERFFDFQYDGGIPAEVLLLSYRGHVNFLGIHSKKLQKNESLWSSESGYSQNSQNFASFGNSSDYTSYYQVAWATPTPETLERELAPLNAIRDSNPKYLLTTDIDFDPVYNGIRKLNVANWLLAQKSNWD